jgi:RNA polymerase sigma factor (TIGR02999 family)
MKPGQVTELLALWRAGDQDAFDRILPLVYEELRQVARRQLHSEAPHATLSATVLVHEVYLRLIQQRKIKAIDRDSFLGIAGRTMRRILVDHARARRRLKRGGSQEVAPLDDQEIPSLLSDAEADEVLALEDILDRLAAADERAARVVEYRVFAGLTLEETARVLNVSTKTVQRTWIAARAFLRKEIAATSRLV